MVCPDWMPSPSMSSSSVAGKSARPPRRRRAARSSKTARFGETRTSKASWSASPALAQGRSRSVVGCRSGAPAFKRMLISPKSKVPSTTVALTDCLPSGLFCFLPAFTWAKTWKRSASSPCKERLKSAPSSRSVELPQTSRRVHAAANVRQCSTSTWPGVAPSTVKNRSSRNGPGKSSSSKEASRRVVASTTLITVEKCSVCSLNARRTTQPPGKAQPWPCAALAPWGALINSTCSSSQTSENCKSGASFGVIFKPAASFSSKTHALAGTPTARLEDSGWRWKVAKESATSDTPSRSSNKTSSSRPRTETTSVHPRAALTSLATLVSLVSGSSETTAHPLSSLTFCPNLTRAASP
mmetsp:Transcript_30992/g.104353  ORF Transcript_30992/g.104353 Transcript_30992/m.104353 type:complete len:355 (+) Transcript_30992:1993-3057(+)